MTKMSDISKKTEAERISLVKDSRETIRLERFKDKFSRKSSVITGAKRDIARALTALNTERRNKEVK